jgi:N utilization substance protein A
VAIDLSDAILRLKQERGMSEELILRTVENTLLAALKRRFSNTDNIIISWIDDNTVSVQVKKKIVDGVYDPLSEIDLEEAQEISTDAEEGDELLIDIDLKEFDRSEIQSAKQTAHQSIREIQKDSLYSEYKDKIGEIIIGYYQRERDGTIYVDLGKTEGIFPKKYQSPREEFHVNDRIKAMIAEVEKTKSGSLRIVLSRTHTDFVRAIFELEVPELYDKVVCIHKIVREPGYRTKLAVYSNREDVDPVGACVGLKGVRIQSVIKELEGEKIDVLKYDIDPVIFIKNALSPAEVKDVIILDEAKHQALAIVPEAQLSLAIGKQGLNVKLANRLVDWSIDVKTIKQFEGMEISSEARKVASELFGGLNGFEEEDISRISELPGVDLHVSRVLLEHNIDLIEGFLNTPDAVLADLPVTAEQLVTLRKLIEEYVDIIEEEEPEELEYIEEVQEEEDNEIYHCPECGAQITIDMTVCPKCGVGLSFEYEDQ